MTSPRADILVSAVAVVRNAEGYLQSFVEEALEVLESSFVEFELILVDDGSSDDTASLARRLVGATEGLRLIVLSRSFGDDIAITAGLDSAIGDFVVTLLAASDPPRLVPGLVERVRMSGQTLVGVVRPQAERGPGPLVRRWLLRAAYRILAVHGHANTTQFRVLSRQAVGALLGSRDRQRSLAVLTSYIGHSSTLFEYEPVKWAERASGPSFRQAITRAIDLSIAGGRRPLRLVTLLGLLGSLANVGFAVYVVVVFFVRGGVVEGWTTLSLELAVMFFLVFACLAAMAEYLGYLLTESRDRPLYYVLEEYSSPAPFRGTERLNVLQAMGEPEERTAAG